MSRVRLLLLAAFIALPTTATAQQSTVEWTAYGGDAAGTRFSPASAIDRESVTRLEPAWTVRTGEADARFATAVAPSFETTPLVSEGVMYVGTPLGRVLALDAATGAERWVYDPRIPRDMEWGDFASRGVALYVDTAATTDVPCARTIFVATAQAELVAVDASTGSPCARFGTDGRVDLTQELRIAPLEPDMYTMTSPATVVGDVVVTGSSIGDSTQPDLPSGEVRGWDARTGELLWSWDPIPQDAEDPAYHDWPRERAARTGGANAWTVFAADPARDLVFVPTGAPAPDYYGVLRLGDNRYANSLVALRASTGERVWSFQVVHHDLWDYDIAAPPALVTLRRDGADVPAVLVVTKTGMLYVLQRETGEPLFPVEERPVPASRIAGEQAAPTQPFSAIAPLSPHAFSLDDVWGVTEEDRAACRAMIEPLRYEGIFTPPDTQGTLVLPSNIGGAHWGGLAWHPERRIAVVPVNTIAAEVQLIPRESIDLHEAEHESERLGLGYEYNVMRGTPYVMRRRMLLGPSGLPCTPPPFGMLVAIDLDSGERLWQVPLGSLDRMAPEGAEMPAEWGSVNLGGPIVTAGDVVFVGAALDRALKAYDVETGRELWRGPLPESGKATPMTYVVDGVQYVAIAVGGGDVFGAGDYIVVFRLAD